MKGAAVQEVLTRRRMNRALLARQLLVERETVPVVTAVEKLVALQAQVPRPPFVGLWTRVRDFERQHLLDALHDRKIIRATALRGTIHMMSTKDFLAFRPLLSEMLMDGAQSIVGKHVPDIDREAIHATGRAFFGKAPAPFDDFRKHLEQTHPKGDVRALAYTVRMGVPLVMVPAEHAWGFSTNAGFTLAESWLGAKLPAKAATLSDLILRYLAAFGPATPGDFQTWSAMRGARETFELLRPQLATFRDQRKRELFDLPKAPRPDEDIAVPLRFLPDYDNALLAHGDRTRIIADADRSRVFLKNLTVLGTVLVDGFAAATWKVERKKNAATLAVQPFAAMAKKVVAEVQREGEALLEFLEPDAAEASVAIGPR